MKPGTKIQVRSDHPHHPNRIGVFQFFGGPEKDCVVTKDEALSRRGHDTLFAVGLKDFKII